MNLNIYQMTDLEQFAWGVTLILFLLMIALLMDEYLQRKRLE